MSARSTPPGGSPHRTSIGWRARGCGSPTRIRRRRCARRRATACSPAAIRGAPGCRAACCGATATRSSSRAASPWRRCSATRAITPQASASGTSGCAGPPRPGATPDRTTNTREGAGRLDRLRRTHRRRADPSRLRRVLRPAGVARHARLRLHRRRPRPRAAHDHDRRRAVDRSGLSPPGPGGRVVPARARARRPDVASRALRAGACRRAAAVLPVSRARLAAHAGAADRRVRGAHRVSVPTPTSSPRRTPPSARCCRRSSRAARRRTRSSSSRATTDPRRSPA